MASGTKTWPIFTFIAKMAAPEASPESRATPFAAAADMLVTPVQSMFSSAVLT
jgi:hypothetical protein